MKRRNADCGKVRRPLKRTKIPENIYGSTFLYIKFLLVWSIVLLADFILEFRFEYLWPFWLLLRSVYDSFKYQGLAFSVFFVCIALTSDMICFLFIPVHWLFFAASTYVWVQYVWHTERGICLPTISLWLLFVYIEASVRLKELKSLPFHLDLCRPFAAHCIGYPVVTLGFGFKSYIGYKMRQRKQKEVAKENHFYVQLLQQALPPEQQSITSSPDKNSSSKSVDDVLLDGVGHNNNNTNSASNNNNNSSSSSATSSNKKFYPSSSNSGGNRKNCENAVANNSGGSSKFVEIVGDNSRTEGKRNSHSLSNGHANTSSSSIEKELEYMEATTNSPGNVGGSGGTHGKLRGINSSVNDFDERDDFEHDKSFKANGVIHKMNSNSGGGGGNSTSSGNVSFRGGSWGSSTTSGSSSSSVASSLNHLKDNGCGFGGGNSGGQTTSTSSSGGGGKRKNAGGVKDNVANNLNSQKDEHVLRLEGDIKRLKADLQASRQCEQELRGQVNSLLTSERTAKSELAQFQQDNESLQSKLHGLVTARQQDKQTITSLEKKLQEERRCRSVIESQLATERKNRKAEEAAARAVALATANARSDCTDTCKTHRKEMETDIKLLRRDLKMCEDRLRQSEREAQALRQYKDTHSETEVLMSALSAMQEKNNHLENSLSAETRLKLDLFSALGEAKRQLEIAQSMVMQKDKEIEDLKTKIAEVMAVMPPTSYSAVSMDTTIINGSAHYSSKFVPEDKISNSNLDPNALVYTPKGVLAPVSVVSSVDI